MALKNYKITKYIKYPRSQSQQNSKIRSHENSILQLTDLILGAITYINRGLNTSEAKQQLCNFIKDYSNLELTRTSPLSHKKINLLVLDQLK